MNAQLIVGLPGSGKTYLAKTEFVPCGYHLIDDPRTLGDIFDGVLTAKQNGSVGIVITDPNLTLPGAIYKAIDYLIDIDCDVMPVIYFENDWRKAKANIAYRNETEEDRGRIDVEHFSKLYTLPIDIVTRQIYQRPETLLLTK